MRWKAGSGRSKSERLCAPSEIDVRCSRKKSTSLNGGRWSFRRRTTAVLQVAIFGTSIRPLLKLFTGAINGGHCSVTEHREGNGSNSIPQQNTSAMAPIQEGCPGETYRRGQLYCRALSPGYGQVC